MGSSVSAKNVIPLRMLCLGDSYTIGEGVATGERWPVQLAARLRSEGWQLADPIMIARTGWTTAELSAGIDAAAPAPPFDLVTLLIGVNNQYRGLPVDEYGEAFGALLRRAIDLAAKRPGRVLVVSIPDWGVTPFAAGRDRRQVSEQIDAFNRMNAAAAASLGAPYVDVTPTSRRAALENALLAEDQLHPSPSMYAAWVDQMLPTVCSMLSHIAS